jgi:hypothetical protein
MTVSNRTAGIVGLCLTSCLGLISCWRLIHQYSERHRPSSSPLLSTPPPLHQQSSSQQYPTVSSSCHIWTARRGFHILFSLAMIVEGISYADLCGVFLSSQQQPSWRSERWGYILLELVGRSYLEVFSYMIVTLLWLEAIGIRLGCSNWTETSRSATTEQASTTSNMLNLIGFRVSLYFPTIVWTMVITIVTLASLLQAISMVNSSPTLEGHFWIYQFHRLVETLCWIVHAATAMACVLWTAQKIQSLSHFSQLPPSSRWRLLAKTLLPMLVCALCYAIRATTLLWEEWKIILGTSNAIITTRSRKSLVWWIGFTWIPTLLPSIVLLYSTRKRDLPSSNGQRNRQRQRQRRRTYFRGNDSASDPLLVSPPGPPAEAFINFQQFDWESQTFSPESYDEEESSILMTNDIPHSLQFDVHQGSNLINDDIDVRDISITNQEET